MNLSFGHPEDRLNVQKTGSFPVNVTSLQIWTNDTFDEGSVSPVLRFLPSSMRKTQ